MALKRPFAGRNMDELISNICHAKCQPLPEQFSPELRHICNQLLSLKPEDRPSIKRLFKDPFIVSHLQTLQRSVERHTRIPPEVREQIADCVKLALNPEKEFDGSHITPMQGVVRRHTANGGWQDWELRLDAKEITLRQVSGDQVESFETCTLTSVCPIDEAIATEKYVFAMKNQRNRAFWLRAKDEQSFKQWMEALQTAIP
ncbi:hypothetical protein AGDE_02242 [Angomonas deanei]|nr:hypothetical protein AGDE_02242 [Angomonas deanei]|eukprot:EPY41682.1 hypothetical protein AGDE_02242 [Angomonas deanei]